MKVQHLLEESFTDAFWKERTKIVDELYDTLGLSREKNAAGQEPIITEIWKPERQVIFYIDIPDYDDMEFYERTYTAAIRAAMSHLAKLKFEVSFTDAAKKPEHRQLPPYVTIRVSPAYDHV